MVDIGQAGFIEDRVFRGRLCRVVDGGSQHYQHMQSNQFILIL